MTFLDALEEMRKGPLRSLLLEQSRKGLYAHSCAT